MGWFSIRSVECGCSMLQKSEVSGARDGRGASFFKSERHSEKGKEESSQVLLQ